MILNDQKSDIFGDEIEQVQHQKQEYYFLGSFIRRAGLKLYAFDSIKDKVYELVIKYSDTIHLVPQNGKLIAVDYEAAKCTIDSRHEVFEALNYDNAVKRVNKYRRGEIKELCNLRKPNPNGLKLF